MEILSESLTDVMIDEKDLQSTFDDDGFADEREENAAFRLESLESYPDAVPFELEEGTEEPSANDSVKLPPATVAAIKADLETSRRRKAKPDTLELSIDRLRKVLSSTSEEVAEYTIQNDLFSVDMSGMQSASPDDDFSMDDRPSLTERKKKAKVVETPLWDDAASGPSDEKTAKRPSGKRKKRRSGVAFPIIPIAAGLAGVSIIIGAYFFFAMRKKTPDVESKAVATKEPAKSPSSRPSDGTVDGTLKDSTPDSIGSGSARESLTGKDSVAGSSVPVNTVTSTEKMQSQGTGHAASPMIASGNPTGNHDGAAKHTTTVASTSKTAAATSTSAHTTVPSHAAAQDGKTTQPMNPLRKTMSANPGASAPTASQGPKSTGTPLDAKVEKTAPRQVLPPTITSVSKRTASSSVNSTPIAPAKPRTSEDRKTNEPPVTADKRPSHNASPTAVGRKMTETPTQRNMASSSVLPAKTASPPSTKQSMGDVKSRDEKSPVKTPSRAPEKTIASAESMTLSSKIKKTTESAAPATPQPTVQSTFTSIGSISVRNASGSTARYSVHVYSTAFKSDAERWLDKLQQRRIQEGYITEQQVRGRTVYNIRFGSFRSKEEAEGALAKYGFPTAVICRIQ